MLACSKCTNAEILLAYSTFSFPALATSCPQETRKSIAKSHSPHYRNASSLSWLHGQCKGIPNQAVKKLWRFRNEGWDSTGDNGTQFTGGSNLLGGSSNPEAAPAGVERSSRPPGRPLSTKVCTRVRNLALIIGHRWCLRDSIDRGWRVWPIKVVGPRDRILNKPKTYFVCAQDKELAQSLVIYITR